MVLKVVENIVLKLTIAGSLEEQMSGEENKGRRNTNHSPKKLKLQLQQTIRKEQSCQLEVASIVTHAGERRLTVYFQNCVACSSG